MSLTPESLVQCIPNCSPDDSGTVKEIQQICAGDRVLTGKSDWQVVGLVSSRTYDGPVFDLGAGRATPDAELASGPAWVHASELGVASVHFSGSVYNLLMAHERTDAGDTPYTDRAFTLTNGRVVKGL